MIAGLDLWVAIACVAIVTIGAAIQGVIGLGMGLIAAPLLAIADPAFLPLSTIIAVIPLGIGAAYRERHAIARRDVTIALVGRMVGVGFGAWVASATGHRFLAFLVAISVLIAVVGSLTGFHFPTTDRNLLVAGAASGFTGTAAGIGGPPMGITYQHSQPATLRATLSAFFAVGAMMSLVALGIAGEIDTRRLQLAALILPGVPLGLLLSRPLIGRIPDSRIRQLVLMACAASALGLLIEEVL